MAALTATSGAPSVPARDEGSIGCMAARLGRPSTSEAAAHARERALLEKQLAEMERESQMRSTLQLLVQAEKRSLHGLQTFAAELVTKAGTGEHPTQRAVFCN